jgi:RNA polymerase sigma factor (sigma-70 family)
MHAQAAISAYLFANYPTTGHDLFMPEDDAKLIPTRASLIDRLKNWQDQASWQEFFDIYWKLIYGVARKSGLTETEAEDVVQETMAAVAKHMPLFTYDPVIGSFKCWLLNMTRWRVVDQLRKRGPMNPRGECDSNTGTREAERLVDPASLKLDEVWEAEWENNLLAAAVANVKRRSDPRKYQIFDLYVNKECAPEKVAGIFNIAIDQVYLIKHRVTELIKDEVRRLEKEMT